MEQAHPRILIVEDDISLASLYKMRLELEGFTVKHSANGEAALQTIKEFKPHLLLLDIMMPLLNGYDVLDIIRNTQNMQAIKVIMLSALSQPADQKKALELGADAYLVKSQVQIADVVNIVRKQLKMPPSTLVAAEE
jgi:two-component system phosphate regulon response regulator PhoB